MVWRYENSMIPKKKKYDTEPFERLMSNKSLSNEHIQPGIFL